MLGAVSTAIARQVVILAAILHQRGIDFARVPVGMEFDDIGPLGRHPFRPAHLHFIVAAEGFQPIITHIFTPDCPYLNTDAVFGVKASLIADFRQVDDPAKAKELGFANPFETVHWDFVLAHK